MTNKHSPALVAVAILNLQMHCEYRLIMNYFLCCNFWKISKSNIMKLWKTVLSYILTRNIKFSLEIINPRALLKFSLVFMQKGLWQYFNASKLQKSYRFLIDIINFWNHLRTSFKSVPLSVGPSNWYIWVALAHGLLRFARARAHVRALMTQKSCAVEMCNAILRNYLKDVRAQNFPRTDFVTTLTAGREW